jgi:hypothetical protein
MNTLHAAHETLLQDAIKRDRTTARRAALLRILYSERHLTREQLITRVEGELGRGCFGDSAWQDTFFRDMKVIRQAFQAAGYELAYSRQAEKMGYYLRGQGAINAELSTVIQGCIAEVDAAQMLVLRTLHVAVKFQQGCSVSDLARQVVANRIRQRNPQISMAEAYRQATARGRA